MNRLLTSFAAVLLLATQAETQGTIYVSLKGSQVVPPVSTSGGGLVTVTVDTTSGAIGLNGFYTGLAGLCLGAEVHGPAPAGAIAPAVLTLFTNGGFSGQISGGTTFNPAQIADFLDGLYYINVRSTVGLTGEVRGQIFQSGSTFAFGAGVNPPASLTQIGAPPAINASFTFGIDNPTGSQNAGALPFLAIAAARDPLWLTTGVGTMIPGWGMAGPAGELLINALPPDPFALVAGSVWAGAGIPAPVTVAIPNDVSLISVTFFTQGVLVDPAGPQTVGLTEGRTVSVGM